MDSNQFSEPNLDDLQAGSYRSNTPYGHGGDSTTTTATSRDAPMRPNLAPYWGGHDTRPGPSEHQQADKSSVNTFDDYQKRALLTFFENARDSHPQDPSVIDFVQSHKRAVIDFAKIAIPNATQGQLENIKAVISPSSETAYMPWSAASHSRRSTTSASAR